MAQAVDAPKVHRGLLLCQPGTTGQPGGLQSGLGGYAVRAELRQFRMAVKTSAD